MGEIKWEKE